MIPAFRWLIQGVSGDQSHPHTLTKFKTIWNASGPVSKREKKANLSAESPAVQ